MEKLIVTLWICLGIYFIVMLCILADLWSGVRKAKSQGIARTSYGYRRTVTKIAQYYNVLIVLTFADIMQMSSLWYLENYYGYNLPVFPFLTLIGAICLCFIEFKSIYEKAEDKARFDQVGELAGKIVTNRKDMTEIINAVMEYMKDNSPQSPKGENEDTHS